MDGCGNMTFKAWRLFHSQITHSLTCTHCQAAGGLPEGWLEIRMEMSLVLLGVFWTDLHDA